MIYPLIDRAKRKIGALRAQIGIPVYEKTRRGRRYRTEEWGEEVRRRIAELERLIADFPV